MRKQRKITVAADRPAPRTATPESESRKLAKLLGTTPADAERRAVRFLAAYVESMNEREAVARG